MRHGKLAVVVAEQPISWTSCKSISANLGRAYDVLSAGTAEYFAHPDDSTRAGLLLLARRIVSAKPSCIVFLDHIPHPAPLIHAIDTLLGDGPRPKIAIHVYGDFTLYPFQWMSLDLLLRRYEVAFIAASPRQSSMVTNFLQPNSASVVTSPFPVDSKQFYPSLKKRKETRKLFKVRNDSPVIVYTGRLSLQKNSVQMIRVVGDMMHRLSPNACFLIAGMHDNLGIPLFERKVRAMDYRLALEAALLTLPASIRNRVKLLGNLNSSELSGLYNAADVFVSPSLHHDEDFGMSPAEALMCGVPSVLSDWGGYGQFIEQESDGYLIPVHLGGKGLTFDVKYFQKAIFAVTWIKEPFERRAKRGSRFGAKFSIHTIARHLSEVHDSPFLKFDGFSSLMVRLREANRGNRPPFPHGPKKGTFYEKVYSPYFA